MTCTLCAIKDGLLEATNVNDSSARLLLLSIFVCLSYSSRSERVTFRILLRSGKMYSKDGCGEMWGHVV